MALALASCNKIKIQDSQWCGDIGSQGAVCFNTLSSGEKDIPKAVWDVQRFGMVCTSSATFADWKATIEKLCSVAKDCDYATVQKLNDFFQKVSSFDKIQRATGK